MKNIINYFYGIRPNNEITENNNGDFYFSVGKNFYCLSILSVTQLKRVIELYNNHIISVNFHNIILNKQGSFFSAYQGMYYVLMQIRCENFLISATELLNYYMEIQRTGLMCNGNIVNWDRLWRIKVDYLEYYVQENETINANIKCLCNYFIGTSEIAISLIKLAFNDYREDLKYEYFTLCHERLKKEYTLYDLYNPKNIVFDHYSRDIAEYLKNLIFFESNDKELEIMIDKMHFTNVGYLLLLARTIFPTFFYDKLSDIDNESFDGGELIKMYDCINRYEKLISNMYFYLRKKIRLPHIEWLTNLD